MPDELQRKLRSLEHVNKWKMRQTRNFFCYVAYAVLKQFAPALGRKAKFLTLQTKRIVHAIRLVSGFSSVDVLPESDIRQAERLFRKFYVAMMNKFNERYASFVHHSLVHLMEDCRTYNSCKLDRNSAYKFESFHHHYDKMIQNGPNAHKQLV